MYSSSSPVAPLIPTEPIYFPSEFYTTTPPGKGASFPSVIVTILD